MIKSIRAFFDKYLAERSLEENNIEHQLQLASAALLVEMTYADNKVTIEEETALQNLISQHFKLTADETEDLLQLAHVAKHEATDYFRFTSLLNENYSQQQKIRLIEYLWMLAYADKNLDKLEEHLIRRLAELLHVPHAEFIQSKHRIQQGMSEK